MDAVLILCAVISNVAQMIVQKESGKKKLGVYTFSLMSILVAIVFYIFTAMGSFEFSPVIIKYAVVYAIGFCLAMIFSILSVRVGPLSLSTLFSSCGLLIPTAYGLIFLNEEISATLIIGLIFLVGALVFANKEKKGDEKKITFKWCIFVFLCFLGNGICATTQKIQVLDCAGKYKSEFMILALTFTIVVFIVLMLVNERKDLAKNIKSGYKLFTVNGVSNGINNFLIIVLSARMPASVLFPLISASVTISTSAVAIGWYKEKLSKAQILGICFGVIAVVFLNI